MATAIVLDDSVGSAGATLYVKGAASGKVLSVSAAGMVEAITVPGGAPSGPAGGVLSGTYPDPGFAVDMATQTEAEALATAAQGSAEATAAAALSGHVAAADPHTVYQKESEKGSANGYASLGADGLVPSAQLPASGAGFMAGVKKDADQTGIGTSATDITGLGVAVLAGQRIRFYCALFVRTSGTTIGGMTSVNGPAASPVSFKVTEWTSATVFASAMLTALDAFVTRTAGPGATTVLYEISGFAKFSANGTFIPRIKAESGGTCSVLEGSWMEYNLA